MKNDIKQKSILLFEKKGFSDTSIQDIVETLGVTKGPSTIISRARNNC
ncbi:TetR family transcriptional regulator [Planococcus faecalis]